MNSYRFRRCLHDEKCGKNIPSQKDDGKRSRVFCLRWQLSNHTIVYIVYILYSIVYTIYSIHTIYYNHTYQATVVTYLKVPNVSATTLTAQNILDLKRAQSIRFSKENSLLNSDCVSDFLKKPRRTPKCPQISQKSQI